MLGLEDSMHSYAANFCITNYCDNSPEIRVGVFSSKIKGMVEGVVWVGPVATSKPSYQTVPISTLKNSLSEGLQGRQASCMPLKSC